MTDREMELAALEGLARNPVIPMADRLAMALQVIDGLNARADAASDDNLEALMAEWTGDPISSLLDRVWNAALTSQADDFVHDDGTVGAMEEDDYIRFKSKILREARIELVKAFRTEAAQ